MDGRSTWSLTLGLVVSILLHLGGAWGLLRLESMAAAVDRMMPSAHLFEDVRPQEPDVLELGMLESDAMTMVWLGVESDPTQHEALKSETEQAAFDPAPAVVEGEFEEAPAPSSVTDTDDALVEAPDEPAAESSQDLTAAPAEAVVEAVAKLPPLPMEMQGFGVMGPLLPRSAESDAPLLTEQPGTLLLAPEDALVVAHEAPVATAAAQPEETAQPAEEVAAAAASSGVTKPGNEADRESLATAIREALVYRPGRPLAAKGVELKTVRPRFGSYTKLSSDPEDAVIRMRFDRTGKLKSHEILQSTGYRDVDRNLLDALYQWKAEGPAIEGLDSSELLSLDIRILF